MSSGEAEGTSSGGTESVTPPQVVGVEDLQATVEVLVQRALETPRINPPLGSETQPATGSGE